MHKALKDKAKHLQQRSRELRLIVWRLKVQLKDLADKVINGYSITREEAVELYNAPLEELKQSASKITNHLFQNTLELCCIF